MSSIEVIHLVNKVSSTSIPYEWAVNLGNRNLEVKVVSYFDSKSDLRELNIDTQSIDIIPLDIGSNYDLRGIWKLYKVLKRLDPIILHTHHTISGSLGRLLARRVNIPVIVDTEHYNHRDFKARGLRSLGTFLNGITLWLADRIVCNSQSTKNSFFFWEDWPLKKGQKTVIHNGVDIKRVQRAGDQDQHLYEKFNIKRNDFLIGNVGMLRKQKNQKNLLAAMAKIVKEVERAKLVIIGSGKLKKKLEHQTKELGVKDNVIFTGLLERNTVYEFLQTMDLFAMTSLWEGFCNAVVEAMAAGLPVIATNIDPLPELIGDTGIYVPPNNPQKLAEVIIDLYNNPKKAREMAKKGQERAQNKFSIKKTVKKYEKLYIELLNSKN